MSNVQFVKGVYEAFGRGDIATVLGAMDPAIEWRAAEGHPYMPSGEPWIGPDAVLHQLFMRIGTDWDGFTVHTDDLSRRRRHRRRRGPIRGDRQGSGKDAGLGIQACHVWRVRDGRVVNLAAVCRHRETAGHVRRQSDRVAIG